MEPMRRFIFRGNAAAYGGRIYRPDDIIIEAKGASSLPVAGGRSTARLAPARFGEVMRVGRASTLQFSAPVYQAHSSSGNQPRERGTRV